MANGEEDLLEKNKDRHKLLKKGVYSHWDSSLGREDAQMLMEKSSDWHASNERRGDYDYQ